MKTKKSSSLQNGHAVSPEAAIAKAKAAKKAVKLAREQVQMLRTEYKQARKALKQAKKASRRARKEAKLAKQVLVSKDGAKRQQVAARPSTPRPARSAARPKASVPRTRSTPANIAVGAPDPQTGTTAIAQ